MNRRVVITGMAINTVIGDNLQDFLKNLLAGKSAITQWKFFDHSSVYSKIGADLSSYDVESKIRDLSEKLPEQVVQKLKKLILYAPFSTKISLLIAADAFVDSGLNHSIFDQNLIATIISGHNLNQRYTLENNMTFHDEPDFIDGLFALYGLDTDHAGSVSELLQLKGPAYTVGAACASGNAALRSGFNEIKHNEMDAAFVVAPILDFSYVDLHGMALMEAISYESFNETPEKASRPYDRQREGFVPAHGGAVLVLEELEHAKARGARIYAELLGVESSADGNHLPQPSIEGQAYAMNRLLRRCGLHYTDVDYISAHATSTQLGDITELRSIKSVFKEHAKHLKINAPKSLLGHTCWSSAIVESVAAILQVNAGQLHPSINIDNIDEEVEDLDVCRGTEPINYKVQTYLNNSFGFGGLNSISLYKTYDENRDDQRNIE